MLVRSLTAVCLSLVVTLSVHADTGTPEMGGKLVDAMGVKADIERTFMVSLEGIMGQLKQLGDETLTTEIIATARKFYEANYKWDELRAIYANAYAKNFSDEEMKAAIAFYESPVGKKLSEKGPLLIIEAQKETQDKLKDKMPDLQKQMVEIVQKHMAAKSGQGAK